MIKLYQLFPLILIILDFIAAVFYLFNGDIRKMIYWLSAGVLSICVTF